MITSHATRLASVLVVGALFVFSGAPVAHAQNCDPMAANFSQCISQATQQSLAQQQQQMTQTVQQQQQADQSAMQSSVSGSSSGTKDSTSPQGQSDNSSTYGWIMTQIMDLFAYLLGMAVVMLDYVAYYTVVQMGQLIGGGSGGLSAIGAAWRILRDLGNIVLIFGFLAVGITTILDVSWYGGKKMIPILLVVAVFLNFSLFISEAVIDVGNLFATEIYAQINNGQIPTTDMLSSSNAVHNEGISNKIMAQLGLTQLYDVNTGKPAVNLSGQSEWFIGFLGIILFLVAAFVMFSLAYILIFRFVALVFLIIIAPVGFAGLAVPKLESMAKKWWGMLFEQTLTAPVLFLLLYIALAIITDTKFLASFGASSQDSWTSFMQPTNSGGFAALLVTFAIAMGLLLAVTILSKRMGAFGADWATKMGGAATFGATAFVGRRTLGRASNFAAKRIRSTSFGHTDIGRLVATGFDKGAKSSFDVRGTGALKTLGITAGDAHKGGYEKIQKESTEARLKYAKTIEQTAADKEKEADAKARKDKAEAQHQQVLNDIDAKHEAERQPLSESIKSQRAKVAELRAKADAGGSDDDKKALRDAELSLNNDLQELAELREKQNKVRKETEGAQKKVIAGIEQEVTAAQQAHKLRYAKSLEKGTSQAAALTLGGYYLTAGPRANTEAAKAIAKDLKKSKDQQNLDALKDLFKEEQKKETK